MKRIRSLTSIPFRKELFPGYINLLLVLFLITEISCRNQATNKNEQGYITYTNDYGFSFDLPDYCEVLSEEDLERIKGIDPSIFLWH